VRSTRDGGELDFGGGVGRVEADEGREVDYGTGLSEEVRAEEEEALD